MQPFDYLNEIFKIDNTVTVPIFVSLVVFITGGLIKFLFDTIISYYSRKRQRASFRNIVGEVKRSTRRLEKNLEIFYPTLNISHTDNWDLRFTKISYLSVASRLDYSTIFNSFKILFIFRFCKKRKAKAFNKIWAILGNLEYIENMILEQVKSLNSSFNPHQNKYGEYLETLRNLHDTRQQETEGLKLSPEQKRYYDYLMGQDKIWVEWQNSDNPTFHQTTFSKLVQPLHEFNRTYSDIPDILQQNNILLPAIYEYNEMVNILSVQRIIFFNYYISYKAAKKTLEKCLKIIS